MTDESLAAFLRVHISYELSMLALTYGLLTNSPAFEMSVDADTRPDEAERIQHTVYNALMESFCIHARSLIEFFENRNSRPDGAQARMFTVTGQYDAAHLARADAAIDKVNIAINRQIAHLSLQRVVGQGQIDEDDRALLYRVLTDEAQHFLSQLKPDLALKSWPEMREAATGATRR